MGGASIRLAAAGLAATLALGCASFQAARLYGSGSQALERGDPRAAIVALERAAELAPHASEIQNHLGLAYRADGREGDARAAFRRALHLDCDNRAARTNLRAAEAAAGAP